MESNNVDGKESNETDLISPEVIQQKQLSAKQLGYGPMIWMEALFKRIVECEAGRGGVEALIQYADQIDFIPEIVPLRHEMKSGSIFFVTAMAKCSKDLLKRPVTVREDEIVDFLGSVCEKCGFVSTVLTLFQNEVCSRCGSRLQMRYIQTLERMIHNGMVDPKPEAVMMNVAYDRLADSYVAAYLVLKHIMAFTAKIYGWECFHIESPQLRNYLDSYHLGRFAGESKTTREEKEILQFLARGCMGRASMEDAERLIRSGINVVKHGYLYEVLDVMGAQPLYESALLEYGGVYNRMSEIIREAYLKMYASRTGKQTITIEENAGGYVPCFIMPRSCWESGSISKEIALKPYRLPVFSKQDFGALQTAYSGVGGGKTVLMSALACNGIISKRELVFSPLNDETNSFGLAGIPLFEYDERTKELLETLKGLDVEPMGVPTIILTVLRRNDVIEDINQHPPTIFDRVILVDNPRSFELDFRQIMKELKAVAEPYGFSRPVGVVCVRNLQRLNQDERTNIDVQVASNLLAQFNKWRKGNLSQSARVSLDELSYLASAQLPAQYAGDATRSSSAVSDYFKESRRNNTEVDAATQVPLEVLSDIRDAATNVFFRDLAMSRDKTKSPIDFLLDSLQLEDPSIKNVVASINNRNLLEKGYWFWYYRPERKIEVIKSVPPTFCLADKNKTTREILRLYEKETGKNVLLESWGEVPHLKAASLDVDVSSNSFL